MKKESDNWVVLGEPLKEAQKVTLDHKAPIAALILTTECAITDIPAPEPAMPQPNPGMGMM